MNSSNVAKSFYTIKTCYKIFDKINPGGGMQYAVCNKNADCLQIHLLNAHFQIINLKKKTLNQKENKISMFAKSTMQLKQNQHL